MDSVKTIFSIHTFICSIIIVMEIKSWHRKFIKKSFYKLLLMIFIPYYLTLIRRVYIN